MRWWRTHWCAIFLPILTDAFPFRARRDERGHEGRSCPVHLNLTGDALHNSPCRPLQPLLAQSIPIAEYEEKRRRKADPVSALEERREEVIHVLHRLHEASGLTLHWMQTPMPSWPAAACSSTISVASTILLLPVEVLGWRLGIDRGSAERPMRSRGGVVENLVAARSG